MTEASKYSFAGGSGIVGGSHTNSGWAYVRVPANETFTNLTSHVTFSAWVRACYDTVMDADFAVPARVRRTGGLLLIIR